MFFKKTAPLNTTTDIRDLEINPYTEWEILNMYTNLIRKELGNKINKKEERLIFNKLGEVEGFVDYLRDTISSDVQRYFIAQNPAEQLQIRGAFGRTLYWKGLLTKPKKGEDTNMKVSRYAK